MRASLSIGFCVLLASCSCIASASSQPLVAEEEDALAGLSIEELAQIQVRSASKRAEPLSSAPAALFVITGDEAVDSGALTLAEALRLAPNLQVQQENASQYSITARGFNGQQAGNKLLAVIDGRTIYTPLASSVFWDLHLPVIEDVSQIEVISGPGGTLFGPNAVNGVVNVVTRDAQETLGTLARATLGPEERSVALRHGITLGSSGAIRFYANWNGRGGLPSRAIGPTDDSYNGKQAGFRSDFVSDRDHITLQGDLFRTDVDTGAGDGAKGHNLLARWSRTLSDKASVQVQGYTDYFSRNFTLAHDSLRTFDVEAQFNLSAGPHELVAGGGVRTTSDRFTNQLNIFQLNPISRRLWVYNGFLQDHYRLTDKLFLVGGIKLEQSTFSGLQVLPNVRFGWQPTPDHLLWAAVSRAVRTPSRIDRQLEAPPFLIAAPSFQSEKLIAFEAGYRGQPASGASVSVNGFVNRYDDLRTTEFDGTSFQLQNGKQGTTYGLEAWGNVQVTPWWRASLGGTTLWKDLRDKNGRRDLIPRNSIGADAEWQLTARSQLAIGSRLQLVLDGRAVGALRQGLGSGSYVEAGGQLSYLIRPELQLVVAGRNLLHRTHSESNDPASQLATRSIYGGLRSRF